MNGLAKCFNLNQERFTPIGISIYGTDGFYISLLCFDKEKSTDQKEHIIKNNNFNENKRNKN